MCVCVGCPKQHTKVVNLPLVRRQRRSTAYQFRLACTCAYVLVFACVRVDMAAVAAAALAAASRALAALRVDLEAATTAVSTHSTHRRSSCLASWFWLKLPRPFCKYKGVSQSARTCACVCVCVLDCACILNNKRRLLTCLLSAGNAGRPKSSGLRELVRVS